MEAGSTRKGLTAMHCYYCMVQAESKLSHILRQKTKTCRQVRKPQGIGAAQQIFTWALSTQHQSKTDRQPWKVIQYYMSFTSNWNITDFRAPTHSLLIRFNRDILYKDGKLPDRPNGADGVGYECCVVCQKSFRDSDWAERWIINNAH